MSKKPSEHVPFGKRFVYDRSTKTIVKLFPGTPQIEEIALAKYTVLTGGERRFSNSKLALEMFKDELLNSTFCILRREPYWVAAQIGVPFIELIGKIQYGLPEDNQNFKAAARKLIPRSSVEPAVNNPEYEEIISALWDGLRCGVSHLGFMQAKYKKSIDIQVNESKDAAPVILYSKDYSEKVAEVSGRAFANTIIKGLADLLRKLEREDALRENRFLPIWQDRWGSY
jgi:hypothetical protein